MECNDGAAALFRLNADGPRRFRCAGNSVSGSPFMILGGEGGFASGANDRSLISPKRPDAELAAEVMSLEGLGTSVSSSEDKLT